MFVKEVKRKHEKSLMKKKNVVGVMTAYKVKNGVKTDELCVTCMVEKKIDIMELGSKDIIPKAIDKVYTDVVEVGRIKALGIEGQPPIGDILEEMENDDNLIDRRSRLRPCPMGTSGGHPEISAGTNGEILIIDGRYCIGTNNHVGALSNEAKIGDPYLQPGVHDGGKFPDDVIGHLYKFVPINMMGIESLCPLAKVVTGVCNFVSELFGRKTRLNAIYTSNTGNLVDAAAIEIDLAAFKISAKILNIGYVAGIGKADIGLMVQKSGRTTYHTKEGEITSIDATVNVQYGGGKMALFENQIFISKPGFSAGGDSGSLILDMENNAVGKLFAGSEDVTIANHIDDYLGALDATLVVENM